MVNSNNITDTSSRLLSNLNNLSQKVYDEQNVGEQISNAVENSMITTGNVVKYYPSLNKSKVKLDNSNKTVLCKNISVIGGDMLCLFTPVGDHTFCDDLKEPCILPRGSLSAIITPLKDSEEWLLLGYFNRDELVGFNPSKQGNLKLLAFGSLGEYSIKFGVDGLKIYNNGKIEKSEVDYLGEDVGDKFYTIDEVDDKILDTTNNLEDRIDDTKENTISFLFDKIYPIGSIYMSVNSTDPHILFGGNWLRLKDTFLLASGDTYDADPTTKMVDGQEVNVDTALHGEAEHTLTVDEMPSHSHDITEIYHHQNSGTVTANRTTWESKCGQRVVASNTGGGQAHNNMPPYLSVYMWRRVG